MLKEESLKFLQDCIDKVENAPQEEIEKYKQLYKKNMECDKYCHSCEWNKTVEKDGFYYNTCILHLSNINDQI